MIRVKTVTELEPGDHWLGADRGRVRTVEHHGPFVRVTFHGRTGTQDHPAATEAVVRCTPTQAGATP